MIRTSQPPDPRHTPHKEFLSRTHENGTGSGMGHRSHSNSSSTALYSTPPLHPANVQQHQLASSDRIGSSMNDSAPHPSGLLPQQCHRRITSQSSSPPNKRDGTPSTFTDVTPDTSFGSNNSSMPSSTVPKQVCIIPQDCSSTESASYSMEDFHQNETNRNRRRQHHSSPQGYDDDDDDALIQVTKLPIDRDDDDHDHDDERNGSSSRALFRDSHGWTSSPWPRSQSFSEIGSPMRHFRRHASQDGEDNQMLVSSGSSGGSTPPPAGYAPSHTAPGVKLRRKSSRRSNSSTTLHLDHQQPNDSAALFRRLEDGVLVSDDEDAGDYQTQSSTKSRRHVRSGSRRRRLSTVVNGNSNNSGANGGNNSNNISPFWTLLHKCGSTKLLVWFLCLVGLTTVSMLILMNHSMVQHSTGSASHLEPSLLNRDTTGVRVRVGNSKPNAGAVGGSVNLNRLAKFGDGAVGSKPRREPSDGTPGEGPLTTATKKTTTKSKDTAKEHHHSTGSHHSAGSHHHHSGDTAAKKDAKKSATKETSKGSHTDPLVAPAKKKSASKEEHHVETTKHSEAKHEPEKKKKKHDEVPARVYTRLTADSAVIGFGIPSVALPQTPLVDDDAVSNVSSWDRVDAGLYTPPSPSNGEYHYSRVILLDGSAPDDALHAAPVSRRHRSVELYPADFTDNTQYYSDPALDSGDEEMSEMEMREPYEQGECVPMQEWQTTFHPSCNGMHELAMSGMGDTDTEDEFKLFGMNGFWRNAWRYDSIGGHSSLEEQDTVVLKTLRINHRFEEAYFENHRIDAVVLERLTASPHVINVFGFCGHSVITEFADGKRLGELADKKKKEPLARLAIARDIANGLADVHGIDGDNNATFVHLDINPANVVSIGGTLKLNDFNIGVLRRWNTTSNTACGIPAQYPNPQWRSPEEARHEQDLTEKVDVFSLGHILFRLICSHEPWHKLEPGGMPPKEKMTELVQQGVLPTIPDSIKESTDPEIVAIREAMMNCYTYDPLHRPSAREIANTLAEALSRLEKEETGQTASA